MRLTKNPYQRAAAGFMLAAVIFSIAGAAVLNLLFGCIAVGFALVAYRRRDRYPR